MANYLLMPLFNSTAIFRALIISLLLGCSTTSDEPNVIPDPPPSNSIRTDFSGEIRSLSSQELVAEMGLGWNLGNSFDVTDRDKTVWGNPLPTSNQIFTVRQQGFRTLRIPVTWGFNQSEFAPFTIDPSYLDKVQDVVNHGLRNGMHVIINVHHDDDWIRPTEEDSERVQERLGQLWTQVAERFISYGDSLIFETLNEPRLKGSPEEWSGGTEEGRAVLNDYHRSSLQAIRETGGNNSRRHIMISTYAASTVQAAMDDLVIPNDDPNVIISHHTYFPWEFTGQDGGRSQWGTVDDKEALNSELDRIRDHWINERGRAVILGEWGARDRSNEEVRIGYYDHYVSASLVRGMLPIVWDDGGNFGLLDRNTLNWRFPEIVDALIDAGN